MNPTIFYIYYFITYYIEKNLKKENFRKNKQKKRRDATASPYPASENGVKNYCRLR